MSEPLVAVPLADLAMLHQLVAEAHREATACDRAGRDAARELLNLEPLGAGYCCIECTLEAVDAFLLESHGKWDGYTG